MASQWKEGRGPGSGKHEACGREVFLSLILSGWARGGGSVDSENRGQTLQGGRKRAELGSRKQLYQEEKELSPDAGQGHPLSRPRSEREARGALSGPLTSAHPPCLLRRPMSGVTRCPTQEPVTPLPLVQLLRAGSLNGFSSRQHGRPLT